jgi:hypothetical protein
MDVHDDRDTLPPEREDTEEYRMGDMRLSVNETANLMLTLGITTTSDIPEELETVMVNQYRHFFELGKKSVEAAYLELQEIHLQTQKDLRMAREGRAEMQREILSLKKRLRRFGGA